MTIGCRLVLQIHSVDYIVNTNVYAGFGLYNKMASLLDCHHTVGTAGADFRHSPILNKSAKDALSVSACVCTCTCE